MVLSLVYFVLVRLVHGLALSDRSDLEREAELLVLRHQVKVLSRGARRPPFRRRDRMLLAAASRILPRERWNVFIVSPRTLLRWHRDLVRRKWTYRGRTLRRPPLDQTSASGCCLRLWKTSTYSKIASPANPEAPTSRVGSILPPEVPPSPRV